MDLVALYYSLHPALVAALKAVAVVLVVMTIAGYAVLAERKVAGWIQGRPGPNRTQLPLLGSIPLIGPFMRRLGLFQPLADIGKFVFKEEPVPGHVNKFYYVLAPCLALIPALTTMVVLPFGTYFSEETGALAPMVLADLDVGILFILAVSSLGVYGIIIAGWASNSKYPFLGGIRSSAQMISYELAMGLSLLPVFLWAGDTLNLFHIVQTQSAWALVGHSLGGLIFLIALFAETNRMPFDMPEAETELVAGYNVEYGAFKFGMFFVAEYAHMTIGSAVFTLLFLGGWNLLPGVPLPYPADWIGAVLSILVFIAKSCLVLFFFMWIRWTLPRFRYDQIMNLGWTVLLPLAIANLIFHMVAIAIYDLWLAAPTPVG